MNSEFWTSSTGRIIRWILFLPIASFTAIVTYFILFYIFWIQNYFSGDSGQWAYVGAIVFSGWTFIYASWYILPGLKKIILYILYGFRILYSILWFLIVDPSTLPISSGMLIVQELIVLGTGFYLIKKLLEKDK